MNISIFRELDKINLLRRSYLCIAVMVIMTFGSITIPCLSFAQDEQSEDTRTVYYLIQSQEEQPYWSHNWSTASDWSGGVAPSDTTSAIFTVGDGKWVRPTAVFPAGTGEGNSLYLGYKPDGTTYDSGILNVKGSTTIYDLVLGNGTIYQGTDKTTETIQGSMTVNGNAYITIHNLNSDDYRIFRIKSNISGNGTLNLTTNYKMAYTGFHLVPDDSSDFTGSVVIDDQSTVAFDTTNVFVNASSITSAGDLTINANQTFNASLNCSAGSVTLHGANLVLKASGTLYNLASSGSGSCSLTNNCSEELIINNSSDTTYSGVIVSTGKLVKEGAGTLTITSTSDTSINCAVDINEGTILLQNSISGKNRFGGTLNINSGGTLECEAKDSLGNGTGALTYNINGGTLLLNTSDNQTLMNKTVNLIGGVIKAGDAHPECQGIDIKSGTTINGHAATGASADNPTVSTISVPIKVRENELLKINVDENAQVIFTNLVYNESNNTIGIEKNGIGVLTFSHTETIAASKTFSKPITVKQGVLQLTHDAVVTHGTVTVNDNGTLEYFVEEDEIKSITVANANKIFSTGNIVKTGDGTLQIATAATGMISAESMVVSSGRIDAKGYINGKLSVSADAMLSPGNSIGSLSIDDFIIGDVTHSGELILNETGSKLLMEIGGSAIDENDSLIVSGDLTLHDGSIIYLAATDDCDLQPGDTFTAVLSGNNSAALAAEGFIGKYVRSTDFIDLQYIQLNGSEYGSNNGKYAITGRRYIDPNAVPEPSTWALLILGVAGLLCLKKLRKN